MSEASGGTGGGGQTPQPGSTLFKQLEEAMSRLDKLEAVGLLAGGIAHDFNNILTAVLGNLTLARLRLEPENPARELLDQAEQAVHRATDLTRQLITFARGGSPVKTTASLAEIVNETASFCLSGTSTAFQLQVAPDLPASEVDPGQMSQVFQNLLLNAAEAMGNAGRVRVRLQGVRLGAGDQPPLPAGTYVQAEVIDEGPGIPADQLGRIFDPYFSTRPRGTGLGLATVLRIVQRHGGHIEALGRPGPGATFVLWVPTGQPSARPGSQPCVCPDAPADRRRVLLMDDESAVRSVARAFLVELGYRPCTVADGQQAVVEYRRALHEGDPFALVILDLTVRGGLGGVDTLRHLGQLDPGVRALISSGYANSPVLADPAAFGFAGVVTKPFTLDQLRQSLRQVLG